MGFPGKRSFISWIFFLLLVSGCSASNQQGSTAQDNPLSPTETEENGTNDNSAGGNEDPSTPEEPITPEESPTPSPSPSSSPSPYGDCGGFSFSSTPVDIGGSLSSGYEPSGIDWHERLERLFLVSDGGIVSSMNRDGSGLVNWSVGGDLEAITIADPESNFVYLGVENPDGVIEFNISTGQIVRQFDLTPWMQGVANSGLEALTFVPDENNPEGGLFYAGHQGEGAIYVFQLPIQSSNNSNVVTFIQSFIPVAGRTDISDMDYDPGRNEIDVIYDAANKLVSIQTDGTLVQEWDLPHDDQEGFARDTSCNIYVAQDTGKKVWFYSIESL